jgi:hypothetical protein
MPRARCDSPAPNISPGGPVRTAKCRELDGTGIPRFDNIGGGEFTARPEFRGTGQREPMIDGLTLGVMPFRVLVCAAWLLT